MESGFCVWLTGLSGAGKSTLGEAIAQRLRERGCAVELLDGDVVRTHLSQGLGYSKADRETNIRRIAFVSELLTRNGVNVVVAAISPYRESREEVRGRIPRFCEVFVDCPIEVLTERDTKGLYRKALAGQIDHFTGISDPYEAPDAPEIIIHSEREPIDASVERIWATLKDLAFLS